MDNQANSLYEADFYGWTQLQASALASRQVEALDWQHLQVEIISLGRQEYRELVSRLTAAIPNSERFYAVSAITQIIKNCKVLLV
jgi:hypothetical protein